MVGDRHRERGARGPEPLEAGDLQLDGDRVLGDRVDDGTAVRDDGERRLRPGAAGGAGSVGDLDRPEPLRVGVQADDEVGLPRRDRRRESVAEALRRSAPPGIQPGVLIVTLAFRAIGTVRFAHVFTAFFSAEPAVKRGSVLALICIASPVLCAAT